MLSTFEGIRRRRGAWKRQQTLTCFVRNKVAKRKLARDERIPKTVDGIPTDVVEIGRPRLHADVDSQDRMLATYDGRGRKSALSVLASHPNGGMVALGSGHGLLPIANGGYVSRSWSAGDLEVVVDQEQVDPGGVWFGAAGNDADFAVVRFPDLEPPAGLEGHLLAPVPIRVAPRQIAKGDYVQHIAPRRGYHIDGTVVAESLSPLVLHDENGASIAYADLIAVATGTPLPFSIPTESGSLVFDPNRRAVGFVVGGSADKSITFVLRNFTVLRAALGDRFGWFFT